MANWAMPPKSKVYEALSALADGRVARVSDTEASVASSDGKKSYTVIWSPDLQTFSSNDNASYWQGYVGYPVIAVLLQLGRISYDASIASLLAGIPWKKLNTKFKRDYDKAVDHVLTDLETKGIARSAIDSEVESIYSQLTSLKLDRNKAAGAPPA